MYLKFDRVFFSHEVNSEGTKKCCKRIFKLSNTKSCSIWKAWKCRLNIQCVLWCVLWMCPMKELTIWKRTKMMIHLFRYENIKKYSVHTFKKIKQITEIKFGIIFKCGMVLTNEHFRVKSGGGVQPSSTIDTRQPHTAMIWIFIAELGRVGRNCDRLNMLRVVHWATDFRFQ